MPRWLLWPAAALSVWLSLMPSLRRGWTHVETDFPNYYTAAVLALHGQPLRYYYDWTWFQRQMNYTGTERQLGAFIPQPPLVILPLIPLAGLPPQSAKQVWLALNLIFLAASLWILSKLSRAPIAALIVLAMAGYNTLAGNFVLGQWYVFLLLLLTIGCALLLADRDWSAGAVFGAIFMLKLYAGPLLVYLAWKRRWRAVAGMLLACAALAAISISWFGWKDNLFFTTNVLTRALQAESNDPYNAGLPTPSNLLRHTLVREPELNPQPLVHAPAAYFFLQPLVTLAILIFCIVAIPRARLSNERYELAWVLVAVLLLSPNRAFYAGIVLLLPAALLFAKATARAAILIAVAYVVLTISLPPSWNPYFPALWILVASYVALGIPYWRNLRWPIAATATLVVIAGAAFSGVRRFHSYQIEPPQRFDRAFIQPGAIYYGAPAISREGMVFESIGPGPQPDQWQYVLNQSTAGEIRRIAATGQMFHPTVALAGGPISFELVSGGHSAILRYDPQSKTFRTLIAAELDPMRPSVSPSGRLLAFVTRNGLAVDDGTSVHRLPRDAPVHDVAWFPTEEKIVYSAGQAGDSQIFALTLASGNSTQLTHGPGDHLEPAVSPDGSSLAFVLARGATRQVWIQNLASGEARQLTEGDCNSYDPAWDPSDSHTLVFASDCQRGLGLGALYRATKDPQSQ